MKIHTPTEFLTFSDGLCDVYTVKNNQLVDNVMTLRFGDRTVGMKRYYIARSATVEIDRLIQVPIRAEITTQHNVVISGTRYKIEQLQQLNDTNPQALLLTLRKVGVMA